MHLLCDSRATEGAITCTALVAGKPAQVRRTQQPKQQAQAYAQGPWTWFEFEAPAGRSEVSVCIKPPQKDRFFRWGAGWWLWAEHPLVKKTLTLEFDRAVPAAKAEPVPLPVNMETEREVMTVQQPNMYRLGTRWANLPQPAVYLDEAPPDEARQDWGTLQRDKSVWEKEMVIAGRKFTRGLGTHANSRIVYDLSGGRFRTFRCLVGRDEHAGDGRVLFQVVVDGKTAFDSGPMSKASQAKQIAVDVAGASTLELLTLDGGDGISGDHGDWAEAQLLR
jgi:hypothetical protein